MRHVTLLVCGAVLLCGCGGGGKAGDRQFVSIGTAPVGGVFYTFGGALAEVLNTSMTDQDWRFTAESTGGSMENIRRLGQGDLQLAICNSSISYFAKRGEEGWEAPQDICAVMTLFANVAMFVARRDDGIGSIEDLRGKRVAVGPEGAGFEFFIRPLLAAHGLTYDDFSDVYAAQQQCVDQLGDGSIAAAFLGGGVPTPAIVSASASMDILLIPYGEEQRKKLVADYPFFDFATIPADTYAGQSEEFKGLNVGSAHLVCSGGADEDFVYMVTKTLWEQRSLVAEKHGAGRAINPKVVVRSTGIPFHPGAIRFYREAGIWPQGQESQ